MSLILLVFAFVCFVLATFNMSARFNLVAAGLAFYMASLIFGGALTLLK
jgi:hypothetical protein